VAVRMPGRGTIEGMDTLGNYDWMWQLVTAIVLIGALVVLVLAYRRRDRDD